MRGRTPMEGFIRRLGQVPKRLDRRMAPRWSSRALEAGLFMAGLALVRAATLGRLRLAPPTLRERALCELVGASALLGVPVLGLWVSYALSLPLSG